MVDAYKGRTCRSIQKLHRDFGPVVLVGPRTVMFSDPAMIDQVYPHQNPLPKSYHWRPLRTELKDVHYPSLIGSESTREHATLKRPISGVYAMSNVVKSEPFIDECIMNLVEKLNGEYAAKSEAFGVFRWMHFCQYSDALQCLVDKDSTC